MTTKNSLPNIFEYIDFKKFLKEYRERRKQFDPGFTNQYICHCLGQRNSKSYFNNVISGRKAVTPEFVDRIIELLKLNTDEAKYFRALVSYNQTMSPKEKEYHFGQVVSLNCTPKKLIDKGTYEYFTEWHHAPIREFLDIYDFDGDYKKLASRLDPKITVKEVKKSVKLLRRLGLIKENEEGILKSTDKALATGENIRDAIIEQYQIKTFNRAKTKILDAPTKHQTSTITFSASPEGLKRIVKRMSQFKAEVRSIAHKDEGNEKKVYEILVHAHSQTS